MSSTDEDKRQMSEINQHEAEVKKDTSTGAARLASDDNRVRYDRTTANACESTKCSVKRSAPASKQQAKSSRKQKGLNTTDSGAFLQLVSATEREVRVEKLMNEKLGDFVHWLSERRSAMDTDIQHAVVRVQADALASALRNAGDERKRLKRDCEAAKNPLRCSTKSKRESATLEDGNKATCELVIQEKAEENDERKTLEEAMEKMIGRGRANVKDAARQLKRTSSECGRWRVDSRKVRRFVRSCCTYDEQFVLRQSDILYDSWGAVTAPVLISNKYYFCMDHEGGKVYSTSMSASVGTQAKSVTAVFDGEAGSYVKGLCFVERVGVVLLLCVPLSANGRSNEVKYELQLRVMPSEAITKVQSFALALEQLAQDQIKQLFTLVASGRDRVIVVDERVGTLVELRVRASESTKVSATGSASDFAHSSHSTSAAACHSTLAWHETRRQIVGSGVCLESFGWNTTCAHALATYEQHAVIHTNLPNTNTHAHTQRVAALLRPGAVIHNTRRYFEFSQCAVSARGICFILVRHITYVNSELGLYDLSGAQLRSVSVDADSNSVTHCLSHLLLPSHLRFALLEQVDEHQVGLVFRHADWGLKCVRVRSSVNGCAWRRGAIELARDANDSSVVDCESAPVREAQSAHISVQVDRQSLVHPDRLLTASDYYVPFIYSVWESESSFTFIDFNNNAVKRLGKVGSWEAAQCAPGDVSTLYKVDGEAQGEREEQVTGMCVVDERSLIVVQGNCHATLVDLTSARRLHSLCFAKFQTRLARLQSLVISGGANRLFVAVVGGRTVYEIDWARESADWRVAKAYTLPSSYQVLCLSYDSGSRRFALAYVRLDGRDHYYRVSVLNEELVEAVRLPMGNASNLYGCVLRGTTCLVDFGYSENEKNLRRQLVYDVRTRSVLQYFDDDGVATDSGFVSVVQDESLFIAFHLVSSSRLGVRCIA